MNGSRRALLLEATTSTYRTVFKGEIDVHWISDRRSSRQALRYHHVATARSVTRWPNQQELGCRHSVATARSSVNRTGWRGPGSRGPQYGAVPVDRAYKGRSSVSLSLQGAAFHQYPQHANTQWFCVNYTNHFTYFTSHRKKCGPYCWRNLYKRLPNNRNEFKHTLKMWHL